MSLELGGLWMVGRHCKCKPEGVWIGLTVQCEGRSEVGYTLVGIRIAKRMDIEADRCCL